jgi:hypothetical protein
MLRAIALLIVNVGRLGDRSNSQPFGRCCVASNDCIQRLIKISITHQRFQTVRCNALVRLLATISFRVGAEPDAWYAAYMPYTLLQIDQSSSSLPG